MLFAHHPQSQSIFLVLGRGEETIISRVVAIPTASRELLSTRPNIRMRLRECNVISPLFCSQGDITGSNHGNQPCFVHIGCQQNPVGTRCACNMIHLSWETLRKSTAILSMYTNPRAKRPPERRAFLFILTCQK